MQLRLKFVISGLSVLADMIYPPVCCGCGQGTGRHSALCGECWRSIRFIERPFCEILGLPFAQDFGAGAVSAQAIAEPPAFTRLRSVAVHDGVVRDLVHGLKYRDRTDLAPMMAGWMARACRDVVDASDAIIPIPLHRLRMIHRKYNQSAELARHLAHLTGKPMLSSILKRSKRTSRQVGLSASARQDNVRGAFTLSQAGESEVFAKHILLVDDVYTTGATVSAASKILMRAGAAQVSVLTFARALDATI